MFRILIVVGIVVGLWWFLHRSNQVSKAQQKQMLTKFVLFGLAGLLLVLVVTGRAPWFFAIIGAAIPWLQRFTVLRQVWKSFKRPADSTSQAGGGQSTVTSEYLQMRLEHDTAKMDGTILKGQFQGATLSELNLLQLQQLWPLYSSDSDSQNLLRAYLEFRFPQQWREGISSEQNQHTNAMTTTMNKQEALSILGLDDTATDKEIINSHKRLMQKLHPDTGGSEYLASKINQAKSFLLKK